MKCLVCEKKLVPPLTAVSHTISPGAELCPDCGRRESLDVAWAEGLHEGFRRHQVAVETRGVAARVARKKKRF